MKEIKEMRFDMRDAAWRNFLDDSIRVVVSTAFKATTFLTYTEIKEDLARGLAPFSTIFIDEAGLMSRAAIAALSLLASRRVILVGDSKQLAPISRISRILPPSQGNWLASSGLSHLEDITTGQGGVHVLREQRRMHSRGRRRGVRLSIRRILADGAPKLRSGHLICPHPGGSAKSHLVRFWTMTATTFHQFVPRRGPGNRSWIRTARPVFWTSMLRDPTMRSAHGLFISPFKAQAKVIASYFAAKFLPSWSAFDRPQPTGIGSRHRDLRFGQCRQLQLGPMTNGSGSSTSP